MNVKSFTELTSGTPVVMESRTFIVKRLMSKAENTYAEEDICELTQEQSEMIAEIPGIGLITIKEPETGFPKGLRVLPIATTRRNPIINEFVQKQLQGPQEAEIVREINLALKANISLDSQIEGLIRNHSARKYDFKAFLKQIYRAESISDLAVRVGVNENLVRQRLDYIGRVKVTPEASGKEVFLKIKEVLEKLKQTVKE